MIERISHNNPTQPHTAPIIAPINQYKQINQIKPQEGPQMEFMKADSDIVIYGGAAGGGKIVANEGLVLTPYGFKKGKYLKVGDLINNPDGSIQKIIEIKPEVYLDKWIVEFRDGTKTEVAKDHLWKAWKARGSRKIKGKRVLGEDSADIVETKTLKEWLLRGYTPQIPVCKPQIFNKIEEPILDPYLLGVLLGDGCITNKRPFISCDIKDEEHYKEQFGEDDITYGNQGFGFIGAKREYIIDELKDYGLLGTNSLTKFIPQQYLLGSIQTRIDIIQGLMDTDGYSSPHKNACEYYSISKQLAKDVAFIVRSLGGIVTINNKKSSYKKDGNKIECNNCYRLYIRFPSPNELFRLKRKQHGAFGKNLIQKAIKDVRVEGKIRGRCITVSNPNGLYITNNFIVTHNSYALLMEPLRYITTPNFNCTIFRKTSPQIRNAGGLWDTSMEMYQQLKGHPTESRLLWTFKQVQNKDTKDTQSQVRFAHLEYEQDKYNFDGSQICMLCFDELQHFSESQFFYMLSRNRSNCGVKPCIRATCNPDADSWLRTFISWWIGEDGLPIGARSGAIRYFMRIDGEVVWADSKNLLLKSNKEFTSKYLSIQEEYLNKKLKCTTKNQLNSLKIKYTAKIYNHKNSALSGIKSVTFIASNVEDNKILLESNPQYLSNLKALPLVERARLLDGNWNIRAESGKFFNKLWFKVIDNSEVPIEAEDGKRVKECRYWDFAATAVSKKNKDPDYTCGIKVRKVGSNYFIINVVRERLNPAELERLFLDTCISDRLVCDDLGFDYMVRWEQEGGSSGKNETYRLKSLLAGYDCDGVSTGGKGKELRAKPLAVQAEIGNIKLMEADWNDTFINELHMFTDSEAKHDDQVDACSGAFNSLTTQYIHPTIHGDIKTRLSEEELIQRRVDSYKELEDDFLNGDDF